MQINVNFLFKICQNTALFHIAHSLTCICVMANVIFSECIKKLICLILIC